MECMRHTIQRGWNAGRTKHDWNCKKWGKCSVKKEMDAIEIEILEKYLPDDESKRNRIVFDIMAPKNIIYLRNSIELFKGVLYKKEVSKNYGFYSWFFLFFFLFLFFF